MEKMKSSYTHLLKWSIYFIGLLIMTFGVVLTIKADLGVSSWDVLHIGLYYQFGLTIGTWSIIIGALVLIFTTLLTKKPPQVGAFINMVSVGIFMDLYLMIPFLQTPESFIGQLIMLMVGIVVLGYGMGLYLSAKIGAGPRDSLMMAFVAKTGKSISLIRGSIEIIVLIIGWFLGGPVFIGTIITTVTIGYIAGIMIPFCQKTTDRILNKQYRERGNLPRGEFLDQNI
jgi:uncharacterized membrane protein YczE